MLWDLKPLYLISLSLNYGTQVLRCFVRLYQFSFSDHIKSFCISFMRIKVGMTQPGMCYARYFQLNNLFYGYTGEFFFHKYFKSVYLSTPAKKKISLFFSLSQN